MKLAKVGMVAVGVFCFCFLGVSRLSAQSVGNIVGLVVDASGASVSGATVRVTNTAAGIERTAQTNESGTYVISALLPADYDVTVEAPGFKRALKRATVNVGHDVTADFALEVGETSQAVSVEAEAVAIDMTDAKVAEIVSNADVSNLPLNGRNAYELSKLVPGVSINQTSGRNADMIVLISGVTDTRYTIDGADASDYVVASWPSYNLSAEVVQEFQVNTNNGDPSAGLAEAGTINIVTKSGGNDLHGTAWGFFRNNQYAAYPGLARAVLEPNPTNDPTIAAFNAGQENPKFFRYQSGALLSGPISKKKRLFWLASFETSPSETVTAYTAGPPFNAFNQLISTRHNRMDMDYRVDWNVNDKNSFFGRVTWDQLYGAFIPSGVAASDNLLSDRSAIYLMGWTSVLTSSIVNDVRVGFDRLEYNEYVNPAAFAEAQQYEPGLLNQVVPAGLTPADWAGFTTVIGTNMNFGNAATGHSDEDIPRSQLVDNVTWTKGNHTLKFGANIERMPWYLKWLTEQPFQAAVFSPAQAAAAGISVPATYNTLADVLQLPVSTISMGIGHPNITKDAFDNKDIDVVHQLHFYVGDSYRATRSLTVNYSFGYQYMDNLTNWDLPKPQSLSKVFNGDLNPTPNFTKGIQPVVGVAWDPRGHGKTVIRAGSGIYYGILPFFNYKPERGYISPLGDGYVSIPGTFIPNPLPGGGVLNYATPQDNAAAGVVRLADLIPYIPQIRENFDNIFTNTNTNLANTNFDFFKGTSPTGGDVSGQLLSPGQRQPVSYQNTIGIQQELGGGWLIAISGVYNVMNHLPITEDLNRHDRIASQGGPVDPTLGYVVTQSSGGQGVYKALLVSATKRMSNHWALTANYAWSHADDTYGGVFGGLLLNYQDRAANYGPDSTTDRPQAFVLDTTYQFPWGFEASLVSDMKSKLPFYVYLPGTDLRGDGTTNDLLPGIPFNSLNRGKGKSDLIAAVASFNMNYAGKPDARGNTIPMITLPPTYSFGKDFINQDLRVSKTFKMGDKFSAKFTAECFNVFNYANLTFYSAAAGDLYYAPIFGQPSQRVSSTLTSGGPRAFQFGLRLNY